MPSDMKQPLPLPQPQSPETLQGLPEAALREALDEIAGLEGSVRAQMRPLEEQLSALAARKAPLATELRRREREKVRLARANVRKEAKEGSLVPLAEALQLGGLNPELPIGKMALYLRTGGRVNIGFAARPGLLSLTDGASVRTVATAGEAEKLLLEGWQLGTPSVPGIRTHLPGTRVEKVVPETDVLVSLEEPAG